ncbi:MAG: fibronectin type III domain-containing protein [Patescibacteria group bacterium]
MNTTKSTQKENSYASIIVGVLTVFSFLGFGIQFADAALYRSLDQCDSGTDVSELQTYLASDTTIYPSGLVTGYYGSLTRGGVERFQTRYGIVSSGSPATTGYGRVGPVTRNAINAKLGMGVTPTGDVYAPLIKNTNVSVSNNNAVISWTSSEDSEGKVYYSNSPITLSNMFDVNGVSVGEPIVSGALVGYDSITRLSHTVNITNLTPNTNYYYLIVAFDSSKNSSISLPATFKTTQ